MGVTSGTYDQSFDLTLASTYNPAFITSNSVPTHDVAGAETALVTALLAGETYLNIHTNAFPGGEIQGFLAPVPIPAVGLPGMLLFLASGGLLGWWRRRQQSA